MTDDLNRLRAVALTDDERALIKAAIALDMEGPTNYREGSDWIAWYLTNEYPRRLPQAVESIVAARTTALLERAERAETERDETQEYRDLYKLELDAADADLAALRAAVTALADEIAAASPEPFAPFHFFYGQKLRSLLAAAPTETEGENT